jgi:hypothetical protein
VLCTRNRHTGTRCPLIKRSIQWVLLSTLSSLANAKLSCEASSLCACACMRGNRLCFLAEEGVELDGMCRVYTSMRDEMLDRGWWMPLCKG